MPALTVLGSHRATRFRPCVRTTKLGISFLLRRLLGRRLREGIVSAVQTPGLRGHGIAPGIVSARFTSRLIFFHIVSLFEDLLRCEAIVPPHSSSRGSHARSQTDANRSFNCECPPGCSGGRPAFHCTVSANVAEDRHSNARRRCAM